MPGEAHSLYHAALLIGDLNVFLSEASVTQVFQVAILREALRHAKDRLANCEVKQRLSTDPGVTLQRNDHATV